MCAKFKWHWIVRVNVFISRFTVFSPLFITIVTIGRLYSCGSLMPFRQFLLKSTLTAVLRREVLIYKACSWLDVCLYRILWEMPVALSSLHCLSACWKRKRRPVLVELNNHLNFCGPCIMQCRCVFVPAIYSIVLQGMTFSITMYFNVN